MMATLEVTGTQMLELMRESGATLTRWNGGFWCLTPQPVDFEFGDSPACPWIGNVMLSQMLSSGSLIDVGDGYKLR